MKPTVILSIYKDGLTEKLQVCIDDENDVGFRLAGPRFNGSGKLLLKHELDQNDADEIRSFLDRAFP